MLPLGSFHIAGIGVHRCLQSYEVSCRTENCKNALSRRKDKCGVYSTTKQCESLEFDPLRKELKSVNPHTVLGVSEGHVSGLRAEVS
jgi:hypothetical protein